MAAVHYNLDALIRNCKFRLHRNERGIWSGTAVYSIKRSALTDALVPAINSAHPVWARLFCSGPADVDVSDADIAHITVEYEGELKNEAGGTPENPDEGLPAPESSLSIDLSEEPLETNQRYVEALSETEIAEASDLAKNPPKNEDGTLIEVSTTGWPALKLELYNKLRRGQEAYLNAGAVYRLKYATRTAPGNLSGVGKIGTLAGAPTLADGRNWLAIGLNVESRGGLWEVEAAIKASGPGGWDPDYYT